MQSWYGLKVVGSTEQENVPDAEGKVAAIPRLKTLGAADPLGAAVGLPMAVAVAMTLLKVEETSDWIDVDAELNKHLSSCSVEA